MHFPFGSESHDYLGYFIVQCVPDFRQAFSQLANALQSGNLSAAVGVITCSPGTGPFAQALAQIGKDLQSKDLDGAQQALSSLQQQQQARGHHRHHHGGISQSQNSTDANDPNSDADTVSIDIQVTSTFDTANKVDLKT
ncbi:MAG: hypothetical protein WBE29_12420 [Pseudolabrys sp.]